jgi:hypothetical protein
MCHIPRLQPGFAKILAVLPTVMGAGCSSPGALPDTGYAQARGTSICAADTQRICRVGYSSRIPGRQKFYTCACKPLAN